MYSGNIVCHCVPLCLFEKSYIRDEWANKYKERKRSKALFGASGIFYSKYCWIWGWCIGLSITVFGRGLPEACRQSSETTLWLWPYSVICLCSNLDGEHPLHRHLEYQPCNLLSRAKHGAWLTYRTDRHYVTMTAGPSIATRSVATSAKLHLTDMTILRNHATNIQFWQMSDIFPIPRASQSYHSWAPCVW